MNKTELIFDLIARYIGMEKQRGELRSLLDLYVLAYLDEEDAATECAAEFSPGSAEVKDVDSEPLCEAEREASASQTEDVGTSGTTGYSGFLHLCCEHCGEVQTFCNKYSLTYFKCKSCKQKTELLDLKKVWLSCECGKQSHYHTNMTDQNFDVNCVDCHAPVPVEYRPKLDAYVTIGTSAPRKKTLGER